MEQAPKIGFSGKHTRSRKALYEKIGSALEYWQWIEETMCLIFVELLQSKDPAYGAVVFSSAGQFNNKLRILNALVCARMKTKGARKDWATLQDDLSRCSRLRGNLVHWAFSEESQSGRHFLVLTRSRVDPRNTQRSKSGEFKFRQFITTKEAADMQLEFRKVLFKCDVFLGRALQSNANPKP